MMFQFLLLEIFLFPLISSALSLGSKTSCLTTKPNTLKEDIFSSNDEEE